VLLQLIEWMVDDGLSTGQVCSRLNAMDIKPRFSPTWRHQNLRRTLVGQTSLMGFIWYGHPNLGRGGHRATGKWGEPIKVPIPAIITEERYDSFQAALARKSIGKQKGRAIYPLGGRLRAVCGGTYGGTRRDDVGYELRQYVCKNLRWTADGRPKCDCPRLRADDVDDAAWREVVDVLTQPERLIGLTSEYLSLHEAETRVDVDEVARLERQIAEHKRSIATVVTDYARAGVAAEVVAAATQTLQKELDELSEQKTSLMRWQRARDSEAQRHRDLHALAASVGPRFKSMTREERSEVFRLLDVRVTVLDQTARPALKIEGRVSYEALRSSTVTDADVEYLPREQGDVAGRCHQPRGPPASTPRSDHPSGRRAPA
jgi:hypothetical protein